MTHYIKQREDGKWLEVMVENSVVVDVKVHDEKPIYDCDMQLTYAKN